MLTGVCPSIEARAAKSRQQSHRSQYDNKIAHLSALSPVSKVIIKLRGAAIKAATVGKFTIESMSWTTRQTTAGHSEKETTVLFCYLQSSLLGPSTDSWSVRVTWGHGSNKHSMLFCVSWMFHTHTVKLKIDWTFHHLDHIFFFWTQNHNQMLFWSEIFILARPTPHPQLMAFHKCMICSNVSDRVPGFTVS